MLFHVSVSKHSLDRISEELTQSSNGRKHSSTDPHSPQGLDVCFFQAQDSRTDDLWGHAGHAGEGFLVA
jgi:hypothetical protein